MKILGYTINELIQPSLFREGVHILENGTIYKFPLCYADYSMHYIPVYREAKYPYKFPVYISLEDILKEEENYVLVSRCYLPDTCSFTCSYLHFTTFIKKNTKYYSVIIYYLFTLSLCAIIQIVIFFIHI